VRCYNAAVRFRWPILAAILASAACGRQALDALGGNNGPTPTPTSSSVTPTPTPSGSATPALPPPLAGELVISELFVRDRSGTNGDANLNGDSTSGDDRFIEFVNISDHAIDIGGVQLKIDTNNDDVYDAFKTFAAGTVLPSHDAIAIFNPSGASLAVPQSKAGTAAQLMFADTTGHTLNNPLNETDAAMQTELLAGTTVIFYLGMGRDPGGVMHVVAGTNPSNPSYDENVDVDPDDCGTFGLGTCDGVFSIALADPTQFGGGSDYVDHRRVGTAGNSCNLAPADSCCRMSPGRFTEDVSGSFVCRDFGF
jgi:hypothetical protein